MTRLLSSLLVALALALVAAAPASAETKTETHRFGPITVRGYEVKQNNFEVGIPHPKVNGHITGMSVDIVDADGSKVPIQRLMLHHIVFANVGRQFGDKRDATCNTFQALNTRDTLPALAERFYAAGEERAVLAMPPGHGYPMNADDTWLLTYMVMNHRPATDTAFIEYKVTYDTDPSIKPVKPVWLDVENCKTDPVFDVPGGRRRGSTHTERTDWVVPESGRIVAGGGHLHGGGKRLVVSQPDCGNRTLMTSEPTWGVRRHPFYNVRPILHEPGPINMSGTLSSKGFAVQRGERIRLSALYDAELPHTRVMGINMVFLAPPDERTERCAPLPNDVQVFKTSERGRTTSPRFRVPIIGLKNGRAREIEKAPGRTSRMARGGSIDVGDYFFRRPNVIVPQGSTLKWRFKGRQLHNITIANGPEGFSSPHLDMNRVYRKKLTRAGTYQMFCGLHPVQMTQTIEVESRRKRRR
jgi:plastocyanin